MPTLNLSDPSTPGLVCFPILQVETPGPAVIELDVIFTSSTENFSVVLHNCSRKRGACDLYLYDEYRNFSAALRGRDVGTTLVCLEGLLLLDSMCSFSLRFGSSLEFRNSWLKSTDPEDIKSVFSGSSGLATTPSCLRCLLDVEVKIKRSRSATFD